MSRPRSIDELLPPPTNFHIGQAEQVRALDGLQAHLRRLGRIEELTLQACVLAAKVLDDAATIRQLDDKLAAVNALIELHNRYYAIEANLPIDRCTGLPLDGDEPLRARQLLLREDLLLGARR